MDRIEPEFMVFLSEGSEGIGAVREVAPDTITIHVENAGAFAIPLSAVASVHDKKVILRRDLLDERFLSAVRHLHDAEDPRLAG